MIQFKVFRSFVVSFMTHVNMCHVECVIQNLVKQHVVSVHRSCGCALTVRLLLVLVCIVPSIVQNAPIAVITTII